MRSPTAPIAAISEPRRPPFTLPRRPPPTLPRRAPATLPRRATADGPRLGILMPLFRRTAASWLSVFSNVTLPRRLLLVGDAGSASFTVPPSIERATPPSSTGLGDILLEAKALLERRNWRRVGVCGIASGWKPSVHPTPPTIGFFAMPC